MIPVNNTLGEAHASYLEKFEGKKAEQLNQLEMLFLDISYRWEDETFLVALFDSF